MRELSDIQADLLECCDVRKMTKMGDLLDELTDLFKKSSDSEATYAEEAREKIYGFR